MANVIKMRGKTLGTLGTMSMLQCSLDLADSSTDKKANAVFSMELGTGVSVIPFAGIDAYGRLTALYDATTGAYDLDITATPVPTGSAVKITISLAELAAASLDSNINPDA